jgi:cytidylate kinase
LKKEVFVMLYHGQWAPQSGTWTYLRAQAYHRDHADAAAAQPHDEPGFAIAISREAGIHAGDVADSVSRRLGWTVWDRELVAAVAERLHARASTLATVDETHVSWLQESVEALMDAHSVSQVAYVHQLVKLFESLAKRGQCIVVGRGAAHVMPAETTLRVRLVAPLENRVAALGRIAGIASSDVALRKIERIERDQTRFVKDHFHRDPTDPANYDLILNVARLSIDDCALQIIDALRAEETARASRFHLRAGIPRAVSA